MRKKSFLWFCMVVTLMLASLGLAQEREQSPDAARARAEKAMRDALKVMRDTDKLTDKQVEELFNIVFPKDIDWDVRYEAFLKENPGVAKAVNSGKISKEKVIAGIKSRAGEKAPTEEEQLEALYQRLLKDEPTLGRTPKAELMPRLKAMLERGEGRNLRPEKSTRQRMMTFGLYFNGLIESGQVERFDKDMQKVYDLGEAEINRQGQQKERGQAADQARGGRLEVAERTRERVRTQENEESIYWDAQYEAYLKENPGVAKAVEGGKISKENVLAGIKDRMEDLSPSDEEHLEMLWKIRLRIGFDPEEGRPTKEEWMPHLKKGLAELRSRPKTSGHAGSELRGTLEYMARWTDEQLTREEAELKKQAKAGGYLKQVLRAIETTLIEIHIEGNHFEIDPEVSLRLQKLGLTNEQVTLVVGIAQMGWYQTVAKNMGSPLLKYKNGIAEGRQVFESGRMSKNDFERLMAAWDFSWDSGNRALAKRVNSVVKQGILTQEEAALLLEKTKFDSLIDWNAKYEQFLKDNPKIKAKVDSGEWTKEQIMTLIKGRR